LSCSFYGETLLLLCTKKDSGTQPWPWPGYVDLPCQYRKHSSYNCQEYIALRVRNKQTLPYLQRRFAMRIGVTHKNSSTILASRCNSCESPRYASHFNSCESPMYASRLTAVSPLRMQVAGTAASCLHMV